MSSANVDERRSLAHGTAPSPDALLDMDVLFCIFSQCLDNDDALAQLCLYTCVCKSWQEAICEDPRLWRSLTHWERLPRGAREGAAGGVKEAKEAVLRRLVARSRGQLKHLRVPEAWRRLPKSPFFRALSDQDLERKLESLHVFNVPVMADLSSRNDFIMYHEGELELVFFKLADFKRDSGLSNAEAARRLALGDPASGGLPDERYEVYLDAQQPRDIYAAFSTYLERVYANFASYLQQP
jgi:hypothetical protein